MSIEKLNINFGTRIEELLNERQIKPGDFYRDVGIVPQAFYDWKKKGQTPHVTTALKIAKYFGTTVEYLCEGTTTNPLQPKVDELHNRIRQIAALANELASRP